MLTGSLSDRRRQPQIHPPAGEAGIRFAVTPVLVMLGILYGTHMLRRESAYRSRSRPPSPLGSRGEPAQRLTCSWNGYGAGLMGSTSSTSAVEGSASRDVTTPVKERWWQRRWVRALIIFSVAALLRIPFRASYLVNWDSVNFALGVESFDLESHQPHPPGYLGYVLLGRVIDWLVRDPVTALSVISVVAGSAATMFVYLLATRMTTERGAIIAAALFGTSPLVWYYSEVALTYILEVALAVPLVLLVLEARKQRKASYFMVASVLLAAMGAIRQTSLILFLPLLIYAAMAFPARIRLRGAAVLTALTLTWLIPLVVLSGGPINYLRLSGQLAELTGGATWLGSGGGLVQNVLVVTAALVVGLHVALLAIPVELTSRVKSHPLASENRRILIVWGLPALLVYLLVHSGQLGYVLVLLPIGIIWASKVFDTHITVPALKPALAAMLIAVNAIGFFVLPEVAYSTVSRGQVSFPERLATNTLIQRGIQQVSLPRNDAHWEALLAWVETFDGERVAVIAEPRDGGSFRHLSFYLPDSLVYGLGSDRNGSFGHLFTSFGNRTNYSVERLSDASARLDLPESVDTLLIPDPRLQETFAHVLELQYETLDNGAVVATAPAPEDRPIIFLGSAGDAALELANNKDQDGSRTTLIAAAGTSCLGEPWTHLRSDHAGIDEVLVAC